MDLVKAIKISASGMKAQGTRLRVIAENLANAQSLGQKPGATPYQRKMIGFKNVLDRALNVQMVKVDRISLDQSEFPKSFNPTHPAADETGYVLLPNVNSLMEVMDMREAQRSYEANLNIIQVSKGMLQRTIDILR